ncbi:MAG: hypothetical protein LCH89_11985 [Proteobacteria bacterium]|nr:hypothetical protein [Pseudomonadota bacterium]
MNLLKPPLEASAAPPPGGMIGRFGAAVHSGTQACPAERRTPRGVSWAAAGALT